MAAVVLNDVFVSFVEKTTMMRPIKHELSTMVQNSLILGHQMRTFPRARK